MLKYTVSNILAWY